MQIEYLAFIPGLLQALGYFLYVRKSLRDEVEPNATTWMMFAYGTAFLTILEWDSKASWTVLVLPVVCALSSLVVVAVITIKHGRPHWPTAWQDRTALCVDLFLTAVYVGAGMAQKAGFVSEQTREVCVLVLLVASNTSTIVSFVPLVRETIESPENEHFLPWSVWSLAYLSLALVTYQQYGVWSAFMIYPASNALLHGFVGFLASRKTDGNPKLYP